MAKEKKKEITKNKEKASVLAFEKKIVPSDAYMYGTIWKEKEKSTPLRLKEKSVRGTISNRLKSAVKNDPAKLNAEVQKANIQTVDACALSANQDTLKLHFTLKVLGRIHIPSACNSASFRQTYSESVKKYVSENGFEVLARRYALNIANARFLWRNRLGSEDIEVIVRVLNKGSEKEWKFDSLKYDCRSMEESDESINALAESIALALKSEDTFLMLDIVCFAKIGRAQDVYPSEELVLDKGKNKKSKVLYHVDGIAAMHSQKIGNALRTIDTWYPEFSNTELSVGPIAVEPYGSVTNQGKAFRNPADKKDFYTLFDEWANGGELSQIEDEHYVMAVLVRGGVFGESSKE